MQWLKTQTKRKVRSPTSRRSSLPRALAVNAIDKTLARRKNFRLQVSKKQKTRKNKKCPPASAQQPRLPSVFVGLPALDPSPSPPPPAAPCDAFLPLKLYFDFFFVLCHTTSPPPRVVSCTRYRVSEPSGQGGPLFVWSFGPAPVFPLVLLSPLPCSRGALAPAAPPPPPAPLALHTAP